MRGKASLLRRSGVAVVHVAKLLEWEPTAIYQVGVGIYCKEAEVFRETWPRAELIGWEPNSDVIERIAYPGLLVRKAVGRESREEVIFRHDPGHADGASACGSGPCEFSAEMTTLNVYHAEVAWKRNAEERVLLWLDCEGSELDVLKGGEEFVEHVDVINVELTGRPPSASWPTPVEVNRWLLDHGFLLQYVHTQRSHVGQFDAIYVRPKLFRSEFCCCPLQIESVESTKAGEAAGSE